MAKALFIKGLKLELPAGQASGSVECSFGVETEFQGVKLYPQDAVYGDMGLLELVHPTQGVVATYSEDTYISPRADEIEVRVSEKDDPATVPAGILYRFTYHAVDSAGRKCLIWLRLKK